MIALVQQRLLAKLNGRFASPISTRQMLAIAQCQAKYLHASVEKGKTYCHVHNKACGVFLRFIIVDRDLWLQENLST